MTSIDAYNLAGISIALTPVVTTGSPKVVTGTIYCGPLAQQMIVVIGISAWTSGTLTVAIGGVTPSGYVYPIITSTALGAVGNTPLRIGQGLTPASNLTTNDIVSNKVQITATVSTGASLTFGVDYLIDG